MGSRMPTSEGGDVISVMKAKKVKFAELKQWSSFQWGKVVVEQKVDGFRFSRQNGKWSSKQGKLLFNVKEITTLIDNLTEAKRYIIDGELAGKSWAQTMTIFRSSKADVSDKLKDGKFKIFDMVDPEKLDEPLTHRKDRLIDAFYNVHHPMIEILKPSCVSTFEEFVKVNQRHLKSGCDGSIIKFKNGGYEFKRSGLWLKYKPQKEVDCKIVGFKEGKGKYISMLGSLEVRVPVGSGWSEYTTNVSGMDDADRVRMWRDRKRLVGTIIEVEYRAISKKNKLIEAHVYRPRPDKGA